jgi:hypothetical protein
LTVRARASSWIVLGILFLGACTSDSAPSATRIDVDRKYCTAVERLDDLLRLQLGPTHRTPEETAEQLGAVADELRTLGLESDALGLTALSTSMREIATDIEKYRTALSNATIGDEGLAGAEIFRGLRQAGIACPPANASPSSTTSTGSSGLTFSGDLDLVLAVPSEAAAIYVTSATQLIERRLSALGAVQSTVTLSVGQIEVHVMELQAGPLVEENGRSCVSTNDGEDLGCFATRSGAEDTVQDRMVERLVQGVERTGRMEEREVLETIDTSNRRYGAALLTPIDPITGRFSVPDSYQVFAYEDSNDDGHFTEGVDIEYRLGPAVITDDDLVGAKAELPPENGISVSAWQIDIILNEGGTQRFAEATSHLIGKQLAILVDGMVLSVPTVQSPITGGEVVISGGFTERSARDLALVLNLGSLPFVVERRTLDVHLAPPVP